MTLSKLGTPFRKLRKTVDRLFCGVLAALVLFASVTAPARAAAGTLAAIAGATVVASFLMASGIYPFVTEDGQSFGEWGAGQLRDLWNSYIDSFSGGQTPSGGTKETFDKISGFITGKTIAIASAFWTELRAFANWIVSEFSVTDNQTGVELVLSPVGDFLPNFNGSSASITPEEVFSVSFPVFSFNAGTWGYGFLTCNFPHKTLFCLVRSSPNASYVAYAFTASEPSSTSQAYVFRSVLQLNQQTGYLQSSPWSFSYRRNYIYYTPSMGSYGDTLIADVPVFSTLDDALSYAEIVLLDEFPSGVTVDTTKVSVPDELPETATHGGLTIPDSLAPTAPAIEAVIEQGVTDRTQPAVIPTVVEIPADVEITDDGTITENPVVVIPEMALPSVADLSLPASVIASFKTKFPFCLPWDVMAFFQPLSVTPQAPVIRCGLPDPFTGKTYEIVVDLSPWDGVAAIVRHFESVIIAVGFALGFRKFVLIGSHS